MRFFSFRPADPPAQCRDWSAQSGRSIMAQDTLSELLGWIWGWFRHFVSSCRPLLLSARAVVWVIGSLNCGAGLSVFWCSFLFRPADSPLFSVDTFSPRPPFQGTWRWFSLTFFLPLTDRPPFFPFFLGVPWRLRSLAAQRCGSGFEEPRL